MSQASDPSQKSLRIEARELLRAQTGKSYFVFAGLDGFIDEIIHVVDQRLDFERFTRLSSMSAYAKRIEQAAGKSCNIEWVVQRVKIGGNGPLMGMALGHLGNRLLYVGAVGWPEVHPVFDVLREFGDIVTLAAPGHTDAVEFEDGKIMNGKIETMKDVRWKRLVDCLGGEDAVRERLAKSDLIALTNWTMLPFSNEIFEGLISLTPKGPDAKNPLFFFDLADPEKRTREDLKGVCDLLGRFSREGRRIILGINHKESLQIAAVAGMKDIPSADTPAELMKLAKGIVEHTGITEVVVHPRHRAAAANAQGAWCAEGPFTPNPRLSTGAGDHFNGGYCHARLRGLDPQRALVVGKATSGYYVRFGTGPTQDAMDAFLTGWSEDRPPEPQD